MYRVPWLGTPRRAALYAARALLVVAAVVTAPAAYADPDTVVVKGGNTLTGSISAMDRGNLEFSIANAGTVDIDWRNIEHLESERSFEVELTSGVPVRIHPHTLAGPARDSHANGAARGGDAEHHPHQDARRDGPPADQRVLWTRR